MEFQDYWEQRSKRQNDDLKSIMHKPSDNEKQIQDMIDFFNAHPINAKSVLDYGCGIGRLSDSLNNIFETYIGADFSKNMVDIAKEKNPDHNYIVLKDYSDIPPSDVLFLFTVLLHIPPEEIMAFAEHTQKKFKYIFIGEHMDEWATKKFHAGFPKHERTWCFNRPLWYYEQTLGFKTLHTQNYATSYEKSEISYIIGEFL